MGTTDTNNTTTGDTNWSYDWPGDGNNYSNSFTFDFQLTHECPGCGAKFAGERRQFAGVYLDGYCPNCLANKLARFLEVPKLEEINDEHDE